ncbi:PadR family transcriptional regulator [Achromobacter insolitus]|uniref:PadR family transcriptional regulator n=1 Tax=Achromobacter insolitus TaxID=217204 RepID=UPI001CD1DF09|nr:PadR family transcriptional regulator [Achromobacter insolitus]
MPQDASRNHTHHGRHHGHFGHHHDGHHHGHSHPGHSHHPRHHHPHHHHPRHASAGGDWFSGAPDGRGDADGFGSDGRGFTRSRKVSSDDLQLMLLGLLEQNPSHGYELIKALGALSNGFYTPSPGMVYPALTYLEELGYATVEQEGAKKRYHLAEPGKAHLDANRDRLTLMFNKLKHVARKMDYMRQAWSGQPRTTGAEGEDARTGWLPEFVEARQALKRALLDRTDASPAEQRRIAAILARATDEITGKSGA